MPHPHPQNYLSALLWGSLTCRETMPVCCRHNHSAHFKPPLDPPSSPVPCQGSSQFLFSDSAQVYCICAVSIMHTGTPQTLCHHHLPVSHRPEPEPPLTPLEPESRSVGMRYSMCPVGTMCTALMEKPQPGQGTIIFKGLVAWAILCEYSRP